MVDEPSTTTRHRLGMILAAVEAGLFAMAAAQHLGFELTIAGRAFAEPVIVPAAIVEAFVALALATSLVLPGRGGLRAGRVLAAQMLAVISILVGEIALIVGAGPLTASNAVARAVMLGLAITSIVLIGWPRLPRRASSTR